jgi:predicted regulator of Ras-like GTPase activity (Roadblock/LC7/MglB family)
LNFLKIFRLLSLEGALLAFSGFHDRDARITSAIASNVWSAYAHFGQNSFIDDPLEYLIINCEGGIVVVTKVSMKSKRKLMNLFMFDLTFKSLIFVGSQSSPLSLCKL